MKISRSIGVAALGLLACRTVSDPRESEAPKSALAPTSIPPAVAPSEVPIASDAGITPAVASARRPRDDRGWNTFPSTSDLTYVVDGYCTLMDVSFHGDTTLVKYGEHEAATVARLTEDGALVDIERLSRNQPAAFKYDELVGTYPDALFWSVDRGGRGGARPTIARYSEDKGWLSPKIDDAPLDLLGLFGRGVLAVRRECETVDPCPARGIVAVGESPSTLWSDGFEPSAMRAFADKSVVLLGEVCASDRKTCATEARHYAPDRDKKTHRLGANLGEGSLLARSRDDVLAAFADGSMFRFDGTKWIRVAGPPAKTKGAGGFALLDFAPDGATWAEHEGHVVRRASDDAAWEDVTPPGGKIVRSYVPEGRGIDGITVGDVWAVTAKGVQRAKSVAPIAWQDVPIPRPPFSSRTTPPTPAFVRVRSPGDVWVNVTYTESYGERDALRYEKRRAFLKTGPVHETLRCRTRENITTESRRGFESWPPRADASCKTPAVVMGRGKLDAEAFPRSRALLKGKRELGVVDLVEVPTDAGLPYVVARVDSFDKAKKLATSLLGKVYVVPPEMVCAEPKGERVKVDAATGQVIDAR